MFCFDYDLSVCGFHWITCVLFLISHNKAASVCFKQFCSFGVRPALLSTYYCAPATLSPPFLLSFLPFAVHDSMTIQARRIDSYDTTVKYELMLVVSFWNAVFLINGVMLILNALSRSRILLVKLLIIFLMLILIISIDCFVTNRSYNYLTRLRKRHLKKSTTGWPRAMDATTSTCPEVTSVYITRYYNIVLVKRKS